jgi:N-acyl-D-amino-acid deacylase
MKGESNKNLTRREFLEKTGRTAAVVAVAGTVPQLINGCRDRSADREFDLMIKGGTVYDGTLAEPRLTDIGIKGDKIAAVGELTDNVKVKRTIDASGLTVTPGFIDVHTHCDLTFKRLGWKRYLAYVMPSFKGNYNYLYQGVTTVVTGNCGYGYTDIDTLLDILESVNFGTNVYHLTPHGIIREELFGEKQPRELSGEQLRAMKKRVEEEMDKGAIGFSTGLEYAPGCYATTEELIEIARVVRSYGGIYTSHIRDESGKIGTDGEFGVLRSINEAIEIGRRAEIPVEISHLKVSAPRNNIRASRLLELIERARLKGLDVTADQYPYAAGSTFITILIPRDYVTSDSIREEFKTREGRKEIKKAIEHTFTYLGPEKTLITMYDEKEDYEGKTIQEIAEIEGRSPSDCYVDMVCEETSPMGVFFSQDIDVIRGIMPHDYIFTVSDGWTVPKDMTKPHPRLYGTFPKKLRRFALDEKIMGLTAAIRSMTSLPAEKFKIKGRGRIAEGNFADIALIDMNTIGDNATYQKPHQYADGIVYLMVNGVMSIEKG